jgi:SAM-dependent methyltransferase
MAPVPAPTRATVRRIAAEVLGPTLGSDYVAAVRARSRSVQYDPERSWAERYDRMLADHALDDGATIRAGAKPTYTRYHYNAVENAILECAIRGLLPKRPVTLDVGAGGGHWVGFYRTVLDAQRVVGLDIAPAVVESLTAAYDGAPEVDILHGNVADEGFALDSRFDVVNAIDVMFHIVDDDGWRRAMRNLAAHLAPSGRLVIAEHVALVGHDAGFRPADPARGEPATRNGAPASIVTKRLRSHREWRACARASGLSLVHSARIRKSRSLLTPANRLLVFAKR